jgi:hypothetical protein
MGLRGTQLMGSIIYTLVTDNLANIGSQCLPIPQGVFWEEIIERSIKSNKILTTEEHGQHQATGSGAGKTSIAEPEEVMMIEET